MAGFHNSDGSRIDIPAFTNSANIVVSTAATAGTKGAWTVLQASTAFDADGCIVILNWGSGGRITLVDIGIGGSGAEIPIASDLPYEQVATQAQRAETFYLPLSIPAGSRISARANISGTGTRNIGVTVYPIASEYLGLVELSMATTYGFAATPTLTTLTCSTVNVKGTYQVLSASTTADIKAVIPVFARSAAPTASTDYRVDFSVGANGAEIVVLPDLYTGVTSNAGSSPEPSTYPPIPLDIVQGSRLTARCQSSVIANTIDVALVCLS